MSKKKERKKERIKKEMIWENVRYIRGFPV